MDAGNIISATVFNDVEVGMVIVVAPLMGFERVIEKVEIKPPFNSKIIKLQLETFSSRTGEKSQRNIFRGYYEPCVTANWPTPPQAS